MIDVNCPRADVSGGTTQNLPLKQKAWNNMDTEAYYR
jgi:hypothetical protein